MSQEGPLRNFLRNRPRLFGQTQDQTTQDTRKKTFNLRSKIDSAIQELDQKIRSDYKEIDQYREWLGLIGEIEEKVIESGDPTDSSYYLRQFANILRDRIEKEELEIADMVSFRRYLQSYLVRFKLGEI